MQGLPHGCTSLVLMVTLVTVWSATLVEGSQLRQRLANDLKPVGLRVVLPDDEATACPMVSNDISVTVRDRLATVTFSQVFVNVASNNNSVEAQYLFPVMPDMAVSSMVATTPRGEYHAEVKERGVAQREYDAAMSRGDGAFLARYDDAQPDLLVMDVGNIPPHETVRMKVVMTVLLDVSLAHWLFELPLAFIKPYAIAGTPADARVQEQPQVQDVPYTWSFVASFGSARPGTHVVDVRSDLYEMEKWTSDDSSTMHVRLLHKGQQPNHVLQLRVYTREDKPALNGAMVSPLSRVGNVTAQGLHVWLTPETGDVQETTFDVSAEYIFVVDRSGSMNGESMTIAKEAVQKSLSLLPASAFFNVISFGSSLFADGPRAATVDVVAEASRAVSTFDADLGGTEIEEPLRFIFNTPPPAEGRTRTVFLITDGQVGNEAAVVSLIGAHAARNRVFTFGIGAGVSPYIVVEGARAGGGQHYLLSGAGNYLAEAMYDSMTHSVWRGWSIEGLKLMVDEKVEVRVLTRQRLGLVYAGDTLSVTGVVEHDGDVCAYASRVVVVGVRDSRSGAVHEWRLPAYCDRSATPTDGSGLVQLAARQVLVEMEDRVRVTAELRDVMINISTRYQVLCSVTSLIAVEHREETPRQPLLRVKVPAPAVHDMTRTLSMTFSASPSLTLSTPVPAVVVLYSPTPIPTVTPLAIPAIHHTAVFIPPEFVSRESDNVPDAGCVCKTFYSLFLLNRTTIFTVEAKEGTPFNRTQAAVVHIDDEGRFVAFIERTGKSVCPALFQFEWTSKERRGEQVVMSLSLALSSSLKSLTVTAVVDAECEQREFDV